MIKDFNWLTYWAVLSIFLVLYYFFIAAVYYRNELRLFFGKKKHLALEQGSAKRFWSLHKNAEENSGDSFSQDSIPENPDAFILQPVTDEVQAFLEQAASNKMIKEELIFALQKILKKHGSPEDFNKISIANLITSECESKCSIYLTEAEKKQLWMG